MDVLLVFVSSTVLRKSYRDHFCSPPLGILYLSAYLKKALGLRAELIDLQRDEWSREAFREQLAVGRPKIVGLSVSTEAHQNAQDIAAAVKSVLPSTRVVLGGIDAAFVEPEEFRQWRHVDVLVRGEGEVTFTELVRHVLQHPGAKPLDQIAGLTFKTDADVRVNPRRELIADLDSLPSPGGLSHSLYDQHQPGVSGQLHFLLLAGVLGEQSAVSQPREHPGGADDADERVPHALLPHHR
jgi:radical SAM superfamily enzyme YgiQ (UPF0313 family)